MDNTNDEKFLRDVLLIIGAGNGVKASDIAEQLNKTKHEINSLIYSKLKGICYQDDNYKWFIKDELKSLATLYGTLTTSEKKSNHIYSKDESNNVKKSKSIKDMICRPVANTKSNKVKCYNIEKKDLKEIKTSKEELFNKAWDIFKKSLNTSELKFLDKKVVKYHNFYFSILVNKDEEYLVAYYIYNLDMDSLDDYDIKTSISNIKTIIPKYDMEFYYEDGYSRDDDIEYLRNEVKRNKSIDPLSLLNFDNESDEYDYESLSYIYSWSSMNNEHITESDIKLKKLVKEKKAAESFIKYIKTLKI